MSKPEEALQAQQQQQSAPMMQAPPGMQQIQWMPLPASIPGCPPGLEYLTQLDQLLVHQQVELFEAFTGIETKNRYAIKNSLGQQCYFAYEESDLCMRICCGPGRGFIMHIVDNMNQEIIRISRPFKCCAGCCWCANSDCCAFVVDVESPVGEKIGSVRQMCSFWKPHYDIMDANDKTVLKIIGPCCICQGICCTCDFPFDIFATDGTTKLGAVTKQWSGLAKEAFTNATNFGLTFPKDLDVKMKSVVLAATFLIDMMFFEQQNQ